MLPKKYIEKYLRFLLRYRVPVGLVILAATVFFE